MWKEIFEQLLFKDSHEGFITADGTCHKTIRRNIQAELDIYNSQLEEIGEKPELSKVRVSKAGEKWRIRLESNNLTLD